VPVQLPVGLTEAAILERDSPYDLLVIHPSGEKINLDNHETITVASSSLRRRAQWLHRFPSDRIIPIRGNVNTRLKKLESSSWQGAIFAAAGLQRIGLRPANAIELDWMIPAPAQGAIMIVCREKENDIASLCRKLNHEQTAFCVKLERDFLAALLGGCSTPIGALAEMEGEEIYFRGNLLDPAGEKMFSIEKRVSVELAASLGTSAAHELLSNGGKEILEQKQHA
jgi:hydroxymethylbilane synthase